jgi:membrane protease subunit (stomatin/prohibitin family)
MARIIDVVEFLDETGQTIVHREPPGGPGDFRTGSQVIVRESQVAVFFRDGKALDMFGPGRHTISTANIPILASMIGLATSGQSPFPAEVIFVNMRQFIDQKWGTPEPLTFRDPVLGMARLRAFGTYAFQVKDPSYFVNGIVGQQGIFTTQQVQNYLRGMIIQQFVDLLGEQRQSLLDLPALYNELSAGTQAQLAEDFGSVGLNLTGFYINAITPTEETAKAIDERAAMGAIGDMNAYMQFKAARAMSDAANNPGSGTGEGMGMGAGLGMGMGMAGMVSQAFQQGQQGQQGQQPQQQQQPPAAPPPAAAPAAASGPLTREQIQQAIDSLDMRFSMGEISEETYNRMVKRWEDRLKEM